jgi:hypothetical protein
MARALFFCLAVLLVMSIGRQAIKAAPAQPTPPTVQIEAVTHNAQGLLRAGDRIVVTLRGTSGGSATFHIFGVAVDVGMREIRSGGYQAITSLYAGTYEVRPGDSTRNAAVFATLAVRGTEVMASSPRMLTIDTRPPVIASRHPKPDARLPNFRPNIAIDLVDLETGVNPATVRLLVNGRNVTAKASISETAIAYNPETPFQPGAVRLQLTVADRARNTLRSEWTFQVAPPRELISSITINPASALTRDEVLTVVMLGAPGGKAVFAIDGIPGVVPMRESQTLGVYFGSLPVRREYAVVDAQLLVTLEKNGRRSTAPAAVLVTILGAPPAVPRITSRALSSESPLAGRIGIGGSSGPGYRILGHITYDMKSQDLEGTLGEFVTVVGADGRWQVSIGPLVPLERARVLLTIIAIDPAGQRSPPTTIELTS